MTRSDFLPADLKAEYYRKLALIESNNDPRAENPRSTASGLYQFIHSTWTGLGYDWKDRFNVRLQNEAIERLTAQNAAILRENGCAINFATLYGSHFLGVSGFLRIMRAKPLDPIESVTSKRQREANPTILKGTVRDFCDWLQGKTGDSIYKRYTKGGWVSGPGVNVPPEDREEFPATEKREGEHYAIIVTFALVAAFIVFQVARMVLGF